MTESLKSFEYAFRSSFGSCEGTCECGKVFFDGGEGGWGWEEGELQALIDNPNATSLDCSVGFIELEGSTYALDCECWHERAEKIIGFLNGHAHSICEYFDKEKERKTEIAKNSPTTNQA